MNRSRSASLLVRSLAPLLCFALVVLVSGTALAQSTIKQPGAHSKYSVELEPHLLLDWGDYYGAYNHGDAFGLGMRATIPLVDNGPISSINNNIGIGFGLDWAHNGDACGFYYRYRGNNYLYDCSYDVFHLPVVAQWNFFLTPIISVFGEVGFGIRRYHSDNSGAGCDPNFYYCGSYNHTDIEPLFWGGGRFQFGANSPISGIVRLGWPYISLGVGIML